MLKGFPPLLPLHAVTPPIKAILEIIKKKCALLRLMVFMQKSGRLYPKSRPAWLPSPRGTVWHRALWLLYLGQVAYFCASTWRNDWYRWNLEHGRAYSRLFFSPCEYKRGCRGWESRTHWHKKGFPGSFGVSIAKGRTQSLFLNVSVSLKHHT